MIQVADEYKAPADDTGSETDGDPREEEGCYPFAAEKAVEQEGIGGIKSNDTRKNDHCAHRREKKPADPGAGGCQLPGHGAGDTFYKKHHQQDIQEPISNVQEDDGYLLHILSLLFFCNIKNIPEKPEKQGVAQGPVLQVDIPAEFPQSGNIERTI